jgi:hypothetical protein
MDDALTARRAPERLPGSFEACAQLFVREAARDGNGGCNLILGRQTFRYSPATHRCRVGLGSSGIIHNQPRTKIQTLAVGRAYEWGLLAEPHARLFIRARLDIAIAIPRLRPEMEVAHELLTSAADEDLVLGGIFVGDITCYAGASAARTYYNAWRVWLPMQCAAVCHAGTVPHRADATKPMLAHVCTGEVPLSKWLAANHLRPTGLGRPRPLRKAAAANGRQEAFALAYAMDDARWLERARSRLPAPRVLACGPRAIWGTRWDRCVAMHYANALAAAAAEPAARLSVLPPAPRIGEPRSGLEARLWTRLLRTQFGTCDDPANFFDNMCVLRRAEEERAAAAPAGERSRAISWTRGDWMRATSRAQRVDGHRVGRRY